MKAHLLVSLFLYLFSNMTYAEGYFYVENGETKCKGKCDKDITESLYIENGKLKCGYTSKEATYFDHENRNIEIGEVIPLPTEVVEKDLKGDYKYAFKSPCPFKDKNTFLSKMQTLYSQLDDGNSSCLTTRVRQSPLAILNKLYANALVKFCPQSFLAAIINASEESPIKTNEKNCQAQTVAEEIQSQLDQLLPRHVGPILDNKTRSLALGPNTESIILDGLVAGKGSESLFHDAIVNTPHGLDLGVVRKSTEKSPGKLAIENKVHELLPNYTSVLVYESEHKGKKRFLSKAKTTYHEFYRTGRSVELHDFFANNRRKLSKKQKYQLMSNLLNAYTESFKKNLIPRDIKLTNATVNLNTGDVHIIDTSETIIVDDLPKELNGRLDSLYKVINRENLQNLTLYTPGYTSPKIKSLRANDSETFRWNKKDYITSQKNSSLFSIGISLYCLLTNFKGNCFHDLMEKPGSEILKIKHHFEKLQNLKVDPVEIKEIIIGLLFNDPLYKKHSGSEYKALKIEDANKKLQEIVKNL